MQPATESFAKILDFEEGLPHRVSEVICVKCGQRWFAIRPTLTLLKELECNKCGPGFAIETGEVIEHSHN